MRKKVLPVAVAALVLSAGAAFAEPPNAAIPGDNPGAENHEPGQLTDADLAAVTGTGLLSAACTLGVKAGGYSILAAATILGDPFGQGLGLGLIGAAGAICA